MTASIVRSYPQIKVDTDMILRGQGADPAIIRARRPQLVAIAEQAQVEGAQLIEPVVLYRTLPVEKISHELITLAGNLKLSGSLLVEQLGCAQQIALLVCTLGGKLEKRVSELMSENPVYAFALDGFGSAATEALGLAICAELEADASSSGLHTSVPLNPGMVGWSVEDGQPQIFSALEPAQIGITLNQGAQMSPRKSVSMVLGFSSTPFYAGRPCDFCSLNETCRYQNSGNH